MTKKKAIEIMMQLKAEYYYAFKDMPDDLFKLKIENFIKAMDGYNDQEIDIALGKVLAENKTLPTIAHFIEAIEKYKESLLPTVEEEWASVVNALINIEHNSENFYKQGRDWDRIRDTNRDIFNSLSGYVKGYYVEYSIFLSLLGSKLDIERARFLKNFPEYRRQQLKGKIKDETKPTTNQNK